MKAIRESRAFQPISKADVTTQVTSIPPGQTWGSRVLVCQPVDLLFRQRVDARRHPHRLPDVQLEPLRAIGDAVLGKLGLILPQQLEHPLGDLLRRRTPQVQLVENLSSAIEIVPRDRPLADMARTCRYVR